MIKGNIPGNFPKLFKRNTQEMALHTFSKRQKTSNQCWEDMNNDELLDQMKKKGLSQEIVSFAEKMKLTGKDLRYLSTEILKKCEGQMLKLCHYLDIVKFRDNLGPSQLLSLKVYNDPVHGHIQMNQACQAIIDTPQFQRLRYLKQLGMVYFVFPGATNNRFEHSLGACHLAGKFVRILRNNQPNLGITDKDILCVEIAGLCHDLGHGPFSHFFEEEFLEMREEFTKKPHEQVSVKMFRHLVEMNKLMEPGGKLKEFGLTEQDITFIEEQIEGKHYNEDGTWARVGRGQEKSFLYEIVSNKRNGIDVDKWDYFARDCHHLGIKNNFDYNRYMKFARVIEVESQMQICIRDKELGNLYNMFYTRYTLHKYAYQHRVKCAIEAMITHALLKANDHIQFPGLDRKHYKMSKCNEDMEAYTQLTDNVLFKILYSPKNNTEMKSAKQLIQRIFRRDIYVTVFESIPVEPNDLQNVQPQTIKTEIMQKAQLSQDERRVTITEDDIFVNIARLDFGMKEKDPVEMLNVYCKDNIHKARRLAKDEVSKILGPIRFNEIVVRVYCCVSEPDKKELIQECAAVWFNESYSQDESI